MNTKDFPTLATASDAELVEELQRRQDEREAAARRKEEERNAIVLSNIDVLLKLVPDHSRSSCSDRAPVNADRARCARCALLQMKVEEWMADNVVVNVTVDRKRTEDDDD